MRRKKRTTLEPIPKRLCAYEKCGKLFQPIWPAHIFHTTDCRIAAFHLKRSRAVRELADIKNQIRQAE